MVKWQGHPLRLPLLRLPPDLAPLAIECFDCILRYCGDLVPDPELTEVKCVYTVLMVCYTYDWGYISMDYIVFFCLSALSQTFDPEGWGLLPAHQTNNSQPFSVSRIGSTCLAVTQHPGGIFRLLWCTSSVLDWAPHVCGVRPSPSLSRNCCCLSYQLEENCALRRQEECTKRRGGHSGIGWTVCISINTMKKKHMLFLPFLLLWETQ